MAKVKVTHPKLTSDDAKEAPKREPIPPGRYCAMIMKAAEGSTKHTTPLSKISVEFQILYGLGEDGQGHDETHLGRRVYQDYILEHDPTMEDLSEQRRWELVMLLDGAGVDYDDDGFDPDHLKEKTVIITVRHREGTKTDDDGNKRIFSNVTKVDSTEAVSADDIV